MIYPVYFRYLCLFFAVVQLLILWGTYTSFAGFLFSFTTALECAQAHMENFTTLHTAYLGDCQEYLKQADRVQKLSYLSCAAFQCTGLVLSFWVIFSRGNNALGGNLDSLGSVSPHPQDAPTLDFLDPSSLKEIQAICESIVDGVSKRVARENFEERKEFCLSVANKISESVDTYYESVEKYILQKDCDEWSQAIEIFKQVVEVVLRSKSVEGGDISTFGADVVSDLKAVGSYPSGEHIFAVFYDLVGNTISEVLLNTALL